MATQTNNTRFTDTELVKKNVEVRRILADTFTPIHAVVRGFLVRIRKTKTTEVIRAGTINWEHPALSNPLPRTTILTKAEFKEIHGDKSHGSSLIFSADFYDCVRNVDTAKFRKRFNLKGRGKIIHVLLYTMGDANFLNKANTDIVYKSPSCAYSGYDGAFPARWGGYAMNNPLGHVIVILNE
jgi:hypothetical protein